VGSNLGDVRKDGLLELTSQRIQRIVSSRRQRDAAAYGALTRSLVELQRITATHMSQNAVIKLTDLELTDRLDPGADPNESVEPESAGYPQTVNWTAPEVISGGQRRFTKAADVFSCGMLLWEVLTGRVPYEEEGMRTWHGVL
jgi:serine/threonine protein kinase